jgi:hypothetical protein
VLLVQDGNDRPICKNKEAVFVGFQEDDFLELPMRRERSLCQLLDFPFVRHSRASSDMQRFLFCSLLIAAVSGDKLPVGQFAGSCTGSYATTRFCDSPAEEGHPQHRGADFDLRSLRTRIGDHPCTPLRRREPLRPTTQKGVKIIIPIRLPHNSCEGRSAQWAFLIGCEGAKTTRFATYAIGS